MTLGRIWNHEIVYATYGQFVKICDRNLFNPTKQTYLDLGFYELPELEPKEGYHVEWRIATREVTLPPPEPETEVIEEEVIETTETEIEEEVEPQPQIIIEEYIEAYYVADPIPPDPEEEKRKQRQARIDYWNTNFFETSLGWVRKKATMKDGSVDNFLTDDLPLLAIGLQNGADAKVIVYAIPDFNEEIETQIIESQSYVSITAQFIMECLQEKQQEFRAGA